MLSDAPRMDAYRNAIFGNRRMFAGKTVLDIGAGTGILSVLCAQAGAKKVYAIEASNIAEIARKVSKDNSYEDVIEVHQVKIEEFEILNESGLKVDNQRQIDIIVSEWMGFFLLHEGMLDSVINARDRFLRANGQMFPSTATLSLAPCQLPSLFETWNDVMGVQMQSFGKALRDQKSRKPEVMSVESSDLLHPGTAFAWIDLRDVTLGDLSEIQFNEIIVVQQSGQYQGVCIWFDVEFPTNEEEHCVILSTSPRSPLTHWKQTIMPLPESIQESVDPKYPIAMGMNMRRNEKNPRQYSLELLVQDPDEVEHPIPCDCILTKCILIKEHLRLTNNT